MKIKILIVDPQLDFVLPTGALSVPNAESSMDRVAKLIADNGRKIDDIFITLDSHYDMHIAHPIMWTNEKGEHPDPFTLISHADVVNSVWKTPLPLKEWSLYYTEELKKTGKNILCIWPPHCIIGSEGGAVYTPVLEAVREWETSNKAIATRLTKGSNFKTENYGVFSAEVPTSDDPRTQFDPSYLSLLEDCDRLFIVGEASSHCVKRSTEQLIENCGKEHLSKFYVLSDCMDAVTGFEQAETDFFEYVRNAGGHVVTSDTCFD
jgi:nicotinamidase-related amidase